MEATWKPIIAGTLNIITGIINLFGMFVVIGLLTVFGGGILSIVRVADMMPVWLSGMVHGILIVMAILLAVLSSLPLIGGVYAIQRKAWSMALAGSVVATLSIPPLGIVSTVLVSLSRSEFTVYQRF